MLGRLLRRDPQRTTIRALYGAIVAQARLPSFYVAFGVPDTVEGRFDLIVLHQFLLMQRLAREPGDIRALAQGVFDAFCRDLDDNLREMGVSDLAVPRRMRGYAEAFYGRARAYEQALAAGDAAALAVALARNVLAQDRDVPVGAAHLAAYVMESVQVLDRIPGSALARGDLTFPHPDAVVATAAAERAVVHG